MKCEGWMDIGTIDFIICGLWTSETVKRGDVRMGSVIGKIRLDVTT